MLPELKKKRQLDAFVNKEDLVDTVAGPQRLLINNIAGPVLFKEQEVKPKMHDITPQTAIEAHHLHRWEGRAELIEQLPVKTAPDVRNRLMDGRIDNKIQGMHGKMNGEKSRISRIGMNSVSMPFSRFTCRKIDKSTGFCEFNGLYSAWGKPPVRMGTGRMRVYRQVFMEWLMLSLLMQIRIGMAAPPVAGGPVSEYLTARSGLPQGYVTAMLQDRRGFIWFATRDGLCRYDGVRFRVFTHDPLQAYSLAFSSLSGLREDQTGHIWIRTENNHIDRFDPATEQAVHVSRSPGFRQALGNDQLVGLAPGRAGQVWVATQTNGFFQLDPAGAVTHRHWAAPPAPGRTTPPIVIRALLTDRNGQLWLATRMGLFRYDPVRKKFTAYRIAEGLPQNDVMALHQRENGDLLLGFPGRFAVFKPALGRVSRVVTVPDQPLAVPLFATGTDGVDHVNQNRFIDQTGLTSLPPDPKLSRFQALSLLIDRSNVRWMGLDGDGVIKTDLTQRPFTAHPYVINFQTDWLTQYLNAPADAIPATIRQQRPDAIRYLFDRQRVLWLTSAATPPYRYEAGTKTFTAVAPAGIKSRWLPNGNFRFTSIAKGPAGEFWGLLGPDNRAVARYNPTVRTFTTFPLPLPPNHPYKIVAMTVDGGRIYLATQSHGLLRADLSTQKLTRWRAQATNPIALPNDGLLCLAQDPTQYNHLWIGTFGSGLCRLDKLTGQIRRFDEADGLPNNVVYAVRPNGQGHLWLSTNRGLCRFDSRTYDIRNYTTDDGLPSEEFNRYHDVALPDGRLIFGGTGGYTLFNPANVSDDADKPTVALTALRINNQPVTPLAPDSPLTRTIDQTSELRLRHDQNFISFDFAALQFNKNGKNQYRYKLTGLDRDWIYSTNRNTATYTNLPPGTYTFVVNASNTSGVWSPAIRSVTLIIESPYWATWWACAAYVLLGLAGIALFLRIRLNRIQLQSRIQLREQESMQLKQLDTVKSRFFANITHEFRTPLTLILTPLDQLLRDITEPQQHYRLSLVHRNASRLLRLINELLDLAKLEAGNLTVTSSPGNLTDFVERTAQAFDGQGQGKRITLAVSSILPQTHYWFDADKLETILNNLLANALRFTPEAGSVTLTLALANSRPAAFRPGTAYPADAAMDSVQIQISDTGKGIPADELFLVFDRFYQANGPDGRSVGGSGIGLALVKELTELMQGNISVQSEPGAGSTFTVVLPLRPVLNESVPNSADGPKPWTATDNVPETDRLASLLVVEDNDDIANYLLHILGEFWRVRRASTGSMGVKAALNDVPDLIISDVLMPDFDGYELCRRLKADPATSHVPILLLTAKTAVESRLEGFAAGADDYITKPFQVEELLGRVRNRLQQQHRQQQHNRKSLLREGHLLNTDVPPKPEDEFLNMLYTVLEARLDDSSFGVEALAEAVGFSRMHLNRKVKALTGFTPIELIRVVRLNRAAELLLTGVSVSEVADRSGFDTAAYFSKVFKDHYNQTPSEFTEKGRQAVS